MGRGGGTPAGAGLVSHGAVQVVHGSRAGQQGRGHRGGGRGRDPPPAPRSPAARPGPAGRSDRPGRPGEGGRGGGGLGEGGRGGGGRLRDGRDMEPAGDPGRPRRPGVDRGGRPGVHRAADLLPDRAGEPALGELRPRAHFGMRVHGRDQLGGRGAVPRALGQAPRDQVVQVRGDAGEIGVLVDHPVQGAGLGPVPEGRRPARHVRGERTEREDVGGGCHPEAQRLLGGHERGGADPQSRAGERGRVGRPGDAEVDHPRAVPGHQHVGGLEVAVDHARPVDGLERLGDAGDEEQYGAGRQRPVPSYHLVQRRAGHVGGGQPRGAVVHPGVDHLGREQAVDPAGARHLLREPFPELRIRGEFPADGLQRDGTAAGCVRQVDHPHAAGAAAVVVGGQRRGGGLGSGMVLGHAVALSTMRQ